MLAVLREMQHGFQKTRADPVDIRSLEMVVIHKREDGSLGAT
jgi:hypothetical protein